MNTRQSYANVGTNANLIESTAPQTPQTGLQASNSSLLPDGRQGNFIDLRLSLESVAGHPSDAHNLYNALRFYYDDLLRSEASSDLLESVGELVGHMTNELFARLEWSVTGLHHEGDE